jgi:glycerol-3-phosphate cytidylyltransferase
MTSKIVITFGTFDVFHLGHLRILQRARELGRQLIVGISTDALNFSKKGSYPVYSEAERLEIVAGIRYVDQVFYEESLQQKREYIKKYQADLLVMGDDWQGKFDDLSDICEVVYLPRTPSISTTRVIEKIQMPIKNDK